ncbi:fibroblast growth factor 21 [Megalops cyprinoides]|uniref:fibroblast growth factor 21 n=1 Tax=Megalops cyprinoides TaxID=118141 RepID=UPI00186435DF|nr:fibroblast growth factor 21 [Megalops cyprinoides]
MPLSSFCSFTCNLCLFVFLVPFSLCFYVPGQSPLLSFSDQVRERHLYTENKRQGLFLEIAPDGSVRGTPIQTANSLLEFRSVRAGETVIKGVSTSLYLCVDSAGHLRGQRSYTEADCTFRELLLADGYTLFLSPHHGLPVSLPLKQSGQKHTPPFSQFLPVKNQLFAGVGREERPRENLQQIKDKMDVESDDPFGMELARIDSVLSPGFLSR